MKRFIAALLCLAMIIGCLTACSSEEKKDETTSTATADTAKTDDSSAAATTTTTAPAADEKKVINLWSFTDEIPKMVERYKELNPSFDYEIKTTIIATTDGAYQPALDAALAAGGDDAPDMYAAEAAFILKYSQGDAAGYAATYKDLGIDVDKMIADANISGYSVAIGTRPSDNNVVALGYQATGGCFIYRRSIAKDTWGTDDPTAVQDKIGGGSGSWDKFFAAAEELKAKGYAICSGDGDIWHAVENSSDKGWIVDGKLYIDPKREAFLDLSKKLKDNGYHHDTQDWQEGWFADMKKNGGVLGFFGPAWLINYTLGANCGEGDDSSFGDWAVCNSPIGFFWGGTWVLANKDTKAKNGVAELIKWITLDCSKTGLQYYWANGTLNGEGGTKDSVASGTVMDMSDGKLDFLGGQNMFDYFIPANKYAKGDTMTQYDESINKAFTDQVSQYAAGEKSKEDAIADFKDKVATELGIDSVD